MPKRKGDTHRGLGAAAEKNTVLGMPARLAMLCAQLCPSRRPKDPEQDGAVLGDENGFRPPTLNDQTLAWASNLSAGTILPEGTLITPDNVGMAIDNRVVVRTTPKYRAALVKSGHEDPSLPALCGRVSKVNSEEGTAEVLWSFSASERPQPMAGYRIPGHLEVGAQSLDAPTAHTQGKKNAAESAAEDSLFEISRAADQEPSTGTSSGAMPHPTADRPMASSPPRRAAV